ncbi:Nucleoside diphosphate kinase 7 [Orchesella cincta]|uniref:Nucleoside diphosphate kinase 7 n=1 Tax=Orchesella cincta TaxID=48709 RepID=A0A1D2NDI3_ORCCI|nr:Nucleoside diphosphate kinase 7 [Orchesella cincta]
MSCFKQCPGGNKFPNLTDVPVVNPCEGFGYRAPFRREVPFKLVFVAQWYNEKVEIEKRLLLSYYHFDGTIEMKDLDRQLPFLSRIKLENIKLPDLFVGNKLYILGRHMIIVDYGDGTTKDYCTPLCERAFLLVRPEAVGNLPCIVQRLEKCFRIVYAKMARMTKEMAYELSKPDEGEEFHLKSIHSLNGKVVVAFFLMAEKALEKLTNLVGEDLDPQECLLKNHQSLRALYGHDKMMNGFYYSDTPECIIKDASFFFSGCPRCTLPSEMRLNGTTTCCVIKPHILREGRAGIVLGDIVASGYEITGLGVFWLNKKQSEEFYEIYKRIYVESEYWEMVDELSIGPCMAVELALKNNPQTNPVEDFRQCVGPPDPDLARKVRPQTLRARHGLTKAQNAVHCTDLPEDAISEIEYFLVLLDRQAHGIKNVTGDMNSPC